MPTQFEAKWLLVGAWLKQYLTALQNLSATVGEIVREQRLDGLVSRLTQGPV